MISSISKLFEAFFSEIAKKLATKLFPEKKNAVCRELLLLYAVLDELKQNTLFIYHYIIEYSDNMQKLGSSADLGPSFRAVLRNQFTTLNL